VIKKQNDTLLRQNKSEMNKKNQTLLVLGAGFTKAFCPDAPLLKDEFEHYKKLYDQYKTLPQIRRIFDTELEFSRFENRRNTPQRINLERLMSRLSGMPFDSEGDKQNIQAMSIDLKKVFVTRLREYFKITDVHIEKLNDFAYYLIKNNISIITLNNDCLLEQYLNQDFSPEISKWSLDNGYGFPMRSAEEIIEPQQRLFSSSTLLLKLHGSINWVVEIGTSPPYKFSDIHYLGFKNSFSSPYRDYFNLDDPLIVPPVMTKSDLAHQPILKFIWQKAFKLIQNADQIIFVGYSFPVTDMAATQLFMEGVKHNSPQHPKLSVIDLKETKEDKSELKKRFRKLFPILKDKKNAFHFDGAENWLDQFIKNDEATNIDWNW
jgi:hypothetical protein